MMSYFHQIILKSIMKMDNTSIEAHIQRHELFMKMIIRIDGININQVVCFNDRIKITATIKAVCLI